MKNLDKTLKLILFALIISVTGLNMSHAMEKSRPKSIAGDYVVELNIGGFFEEEEKVLEFGFDFEYFVPGYHHHLSIGLATEVEFRSEDEFFFAPLISYYYHHFKFFLASGILTKFHESEWKTKFGIGHEFFLAPEWILIPSIAYDRINEENGFSIAVGIGHEF